MMNAKQINIDGKMFNVVDYSEYCTMKDKDYYTAVKVNYYDSSLILPIRSPLDNKPGIYDKGVIDIIIEPDPNDAQYSESNVIDLTNAKTMDALLSSQAKCKDIEREILTSPENITKPNISSLDSPEMKGLKEAIIAKHIDIDTYANRFGPNFANDKRLLKANSITNKMLKRMMKHLDIKAKLVLEDSSPDVVNPMGKSIEVSITDDEELE